MRPLAEKAVERVTRFMYTGEGRCTLQELRQVAASCLGSYDQLAEDAQITSVMGRKVIVRDGWVTFDPPHKKL